MASPSQDDVGLLDSSLSGRGGPFGKIMRCRKQGRSLMERLEVRVLLSAAYVPQLEAVEPAAVIPAVRAHRHHHRRRVDPAVTIAPEVTSVPPSAADAP